MTKVVIGVDLGGTRLRAGKLDENLNILQREEKLTKAEEGRDAVIGRIKTIIRTVMPTEDSDEELVGIGISVPGPCNPETGVVIAPPNLPGWRDVPLSQIMEDEFGCSVYLGNDANVAALAEAALGSAQGYRHSIYITVSTGIGSGIINDGRLILGQTGIGNEAGHMVMIVDDGRISTLEKEAAGPALAKQAVARIKKGDASAMSDMVGGDLSKIDGKLVGDAAENGDPLACDIVRRGGKIVGLGIVNLLHLFNPEIVVIGGGVSYIGEMWFEEIHEAVRNNTLDDDYWRDTPIVPSNISEDVSILGSATLVLTKGGRKKLNKALSSTDE